MTAEDAVLKRVLEGRTIRSVQINSTQISPIKYCPGSVTITMEGGEIVTFRVGGFDSAPNYVEVEISGEGVIMT